MKLGGWRRLGIVALVLYSTTVVVLALGSERLPRMESVHREWILAAARVIGDADGTPLLRQDLIARLMSDEPSEGVALLEQIAAEGPLSGVVREVNRAYETRFKERQRDYWLGVLGLIAAAPVLMFGTEWAARWVYRGFRRDRAM